MTTEDRLMYILNKELAAQGAIAFDVVMPSSFRPKAGSFMWRASARVFVTGERLTVASKDGASVCVRDGITVRRGKGEGEADIMVCAKAKKAKK